jgi:hypothetical protein
VAEKLDWKGLKIKKASETGKSCRTRSDIGSERVKINAERNGLDVRVFLGSVVECF